jgi:hypothetical protein
MAELWGEVTQPLILVFLLTFLVALVVSWRQVRWNVRPDLRSIPAFDALRGITARAIEAGRSLHVSLGVGGITGDTTADSLAGLSALEYLSGQSAAIGSPPIVTLADPTLLPLAQDVMRRPFSENRGGVTSTVGSVRWISSEPAAYAAGVIGILDGEDVDASVMIGSFGDEYLLMGEVASRRGIVQIGAASDPNVLPFVFATADETLLGEDMYTAGAYLLNKPWHIASLLAQDFMRWVIVVVIVVFVVLNSLF